MRFVADDGSKLAMHRLVIIVLMTNSAAKLDQLEGIGVVEASNHFRILTHDPEVTRKVARTQSGAQIKEDTKSGISGETKL
jgi:hypothetical protein